MRVSDRQYIGTLATSEELGNDRQNVFINNLQAIQYTVKSLTLPQQDITMATGYMSSFDEYTDLKDDPYSDNEERIENFEWQVTNNLFVYTYRVVGDGQGKLGDGRASLARKPMDFNKGDKFYPIPVFGKKTENISDWETERGYYLFRNMTSLEEFEGRIKEKKSLGATYGYDPDMFVPSFVIWADEEHLYAVGHVTKSYEAIGGGLTVECDYITHVELDDYINSVVYQENTNPSIMFIPERVYTALEKKILSDEITLEEDEQIEIYAEEQAGDENQAQIMEVQLLEVTKKTEVIEEPEVDTAKKDDEEIIQMMDYHSVRSGLHYDKKDFINLHTAIKCSNLVILSGLSGTGKSQIVEMYAASLGINKNADPDAVNRLLFIPVRPSWNDDSDLLGYVDLVHMVYRPSESGLVDFLVRAQEEQNKKNIFIVCFDEMNLARVEHYFSQFLSMLERPIGQRVIPLYDKQYSGKLYNSKEYPSSIEIGENVKFIGTVNIDESTYHFSDKVLDRANVIELNVLNYATDWTTRKYKQTVSAPKWTMEDYKAICKSDVVIEPRVHELLWDIHQMLCSTSSKFGVGPRVVKSIDKYLANLPEQLSDTLSVPEGIDLQITQRVLTKVRGSENEIGTLLLTDGKNSFDEIFEKYSDLSDFRKSRLVIEQKQKELKAYGYCI